MLLKLTLVSSYLDTYFIQPVIKSLQPTKYWNLKFLCVRRHASVVKLRDVGALAVIILLTLRLC